MHTLMEVSEDQYRNVVEGSGTNVGTRETPAEVEDTSEFILEKYLEDFIVSNFTTIFKGRMRIFQETEENDGQQYSTDIGPIDILAIEPESGAFVVIELKKGRPSDHVVGQVLRYMGWVKQNLCARDQEVKGLVICREHDLKLNYALSMIRNIDVRYYNVSFKLRENP